MKTWWREWVKAFVWQSTCRGEEVRGHSVMMMTFPSGSNKHQSAVTCLQFCRGLVLSSSDDGTVKLWDLRTGAWLRDVVALQSRGSGRDHHRIYSHIHIILLPCVCDNLAFFLRYRFACQLILHFLDTVILDCCLFSDWPPCRSSSESQPMTCPPSFLHRWRCVANQGVRHSAGVRCRQQERNGGNQTAGAGLWPGRQEDRDGLSDVIRRRRETKTPWKKIWEFIFYRKT